MLDFLSVIIGLSIFAAGLNFIYTIYIWLRYGEWAVVSIGWWLDYVIEIKEIATGWKGADKILNYFTYKINASFTLLIIALIGFLIATYFSNKEAERKD